jgi:hypothetical protein
MITDMGNRKEGDNLTSEGIRIDGIYAGFPYEGPPLNLKNGDPDQMKPRLVATVTVDTFLMDDEEDVKKYKKHMEDVGRGWAQISLEDVQWIASRETWKIFLRLMHQKYIEPEDLSRVSET